MDRILFLLAEEKKQEDYGCPAKYLYTSDINKKLVNYLDASYSDYLYIGINKGVVLPNEYLEPYELKSISGGNMKLWSICTAQLVERYLRENGLISICTLYSGNTFSMLETLLSKVCPVETPMKYFVNNELKIRWIYDYITKKVTNKLSNR